MPVLSPHRSASSALRGSFTTLDHHRPTYYGSSSSGYNPPRFSSYSSERYTTRSYTDADGRRIYSRSGSVTEDGITTRFREESRESSIRRDSVSRDLFGTYRDSNDSTYPRRDGSYRDRERSVDVGGATTRPSVLSIHDSVAELRNKYSPANYVPACIREKNDNISRSKSINDIGLPPIEKGGLGGGRKKVKGVAPSLSAQHNHHNNNNHNLFTSNSTNHECNNKPNNDDTMNGNNRTSVADLRRKFAPIETTNTTSTNHKTSQRVLEIDSKICENRFKKQDEQRGIAGKTESQELSNGLANHTQLDEQHDQSEASHIGNGIGEDVETSKKGETNGGVGGKEQEELEEKREREVVTNGDSVTVIQEPKSRENNHDVTAATSAALSTGVQSKSSNSNASSTSSRYSTASRRTANLYDDNYNNNNNNNGHVNNLNNNNQKVLGLNGLKNIGNTCFMNSVIQCLSNTTLLLEYLVKDAYISDINTTMSGMKGALIRAFAEVIKELWSEDSVDRVVNTTSLKSQIQRFAPRFIGYAQQDAQEFLRYLLEGLHEDVNRVKEKPKPILTEIDEKLSDAEKAAESWARYLRMDNSRIVDHFVGQLKSTLKCTHCGHCSVTFDPFWDLSLPIPQRTGQVRLSQCLESFTREETLDGDEKPTCSKCKERRRCTKSFKIQRFPKILVIHLKRFSLAERFRGKLSGTVDFPLEGLDMSQYAADQVTPCRYNLYAISNHSGTTYSGHYTAYCRHPYAKTWHEYNDSRVSSISSKSIVSNEAYVLFYELDAKKAHL